MDEYQPFDSKNKNEERYDSLWHTTNINFEIFKVYHHDADDDIFLWKSSFPNIVQNFIHIHAQSSYRNDEMLVGVYSWYDLKRRVFPKQGNVINFVQISLFGKKSYFFHAFLCLLSIDLSHLRLFILRYTFFCWSTVLRCVFLNSICANKSPKILTVSCVSHIFLQKAVKSLIFSFFTQFMDDNQDWVCLPIWTTHHQQHPSSSWISLSLSRGYCWLPG